MPSAHIAAFLREGHPRPRARAWTAGWGWRTGAEGPWKPTPLEVRWSPGGHTTHSMSPCTALKGTSTGEKARSRPSPLTAVWGLQEQPALLKGLPLADPSSPGAFCLWTRAKELECGLRCQPRSLPHTGWASSPQALACCQAPGGKCHHPSLGVQDPAWVWTQPRGLWLPAHWFRWKKPPGSWPPVGLAQGDRPSAI